MTNEEKANEIARDMLPFNNAEYHACYNSAMKAMQWKDEQVVEKCKYFRDHTRFGGYYNRRGILDVTKLFDDLIKFIKGEE